jgi:hypothetical protein
MKKLIFTVFIATALTSSLAFGQGSNERRFFDDLSSRLRSVKYLSNYESGWGGNNEFFKLAKEFVRFRTAKDFHKMLNDRNPIVRAMGILCLAQSEADSRHAILLSHINDKEEVFLHQGCIVSRITIGEFTRRLLNNPYFLDPEGKPEVLRVLPA